MGDFADQAKNLGLDLSENQLSLFDQYRSLIQEWNHRIDITTITEDEEINRRHFLDSLSIFRLIPSDFSGRVVDIGTGGGLPGIPMKIYDPAIQLFLLDSLNKRIQFLDQVIQELALTNTKTCHGRAEEVFRNKKYRENFDLAVSRAVAPLPTLLEYALPAVRVGGLFIAMKGPKGLEELKISEQAIQQLGGKLETADHFLWSTKTMSACLLR